MIKIEDGRNRFYQWDLGQRLLIEGFAAGTEVHFAARRNGSVERLNKDGQSALIVEAYSENGKVYANVPNLLLQRAGELCVYIYPKAGDAAHTAERKVIDVIPRAKPDDYVYTETEVKRWEDLAKGADEAIAAVNDAASDAKAAAAYANNKAKEAEAAANRADAAAASRADCIHIGDDEPTGSEKVWIDTDEAPEAAIDVTAEVGQTVVVKAVDEKGRPTEWEAADYQPRTHWQGEKVMLTHTFEGGAATGKNSYMGAPAMGLTVGKTYKVVLNDITYTLVAQLGRNTRLGHDVIWLGNPTIVGGTANDIPFCIADAVGVDCWVATGMVEETNTISVIGIDDEAHPIPAKYLSEGFPYTITVSKHTSDGVVGYSCNETVTGLMETFNSGREIRMQVASIGSSECYRYSMCAYESTESGGKFVFGSFKGIDGSTPRFLFLVPQEDGTYMVQESD